MSQRHLDDSKPESEAYENLRDSVGDSKRDIVGESVEKNNNTQESNNGDYSVNKSLLKQTYIFVGVCQACFFIYVSILPYLAREHKFNVISFGYIQSAAAILQLTMAPLLGKYGDSHGALSVLTLNAGSAALAHLLMGSAGWAGWGLIVLSRVAACAQDIRGGAQMMISEIHKDSPKQVRSASLATITLPISAGMMLGPLVSGQLVKYLGQHGALMVTWMAPLICLLSLIRCAPKTDDVKDYSGKTKPSANFKEMLSRPSVVKLLIIRALTVVPMMTLAQSLAAIMMQQFDLSPQLNGLVMSTNGVFQIVINAFLVKKINAKLDSKVILQISPLIGLAAYLAMTQVSGFSALVLLLFPWQLSSLLVENQVITRLTGSVKQNEIGSAIGVNMAVFQFARIFAPTCGAHLAERYGVAGIASLGAMCMVLLSSFLHFSAPSEDKDDATKKKEL